VLRQVHSGSVCQEINEHQEKKDTWGMSFTYWSALQFPLATMAHCAPGAAVGGTRRCAEAARGSSLFKSLGFNGQLPVPQLDPFRSGLGSVSLAPYLGNCGWDPYYLRCTLAIWCKAGLDDILSTLLVDGSSLPSMILHASGSSFHGNPTIKTWLDVHGIFTCLLTTWIIIWWCSMIRRFRRNKTTSGWKLQQPTWFLRRVSSSSSWRTYPRTFGAMAG